MSADDWPRRPDGKPKRFSEMTTDEKRAAIVQVAARVHAHFDDPEVRAAMEKALADLRKKAGD